MVEFDREEAATTYKKSQLNDTNFWRTIFIIFLVLVIIVILGELVKFQQYKKEVSQQKIDIANKSLQEGYEQGKSECPICTISSCESTNLTVKNIALEQTKTGNIILYNGTHVVYLSIKSICQEFNKNATS